MGSKNPHQTKDFSRSSKSRRSIVGPMDHDRYACLHGMGLINAQAQESIELRVSLLLCLVWLRSFVSRTRKSMVNLPRAAPASKNVCFALQPRRARTEGQTQSSSSLIVLTRRWFLPVGQRTFHLPLAASMSKARGCTIKQKRAHP